MVAHKMGTRKSQTDEHMYIRLLQHVLKDAYLAFPEIPSRECNRDCITVASRVGAEGLGFLTKVLPRLGKAFEQGLESGRLLVPREFRRKSTPKGRENIPTFMSALFALIFAQQGDLHPCANPPIAEIRQVCYCLYKLEIHYSERQVDFACRKVVEIERQLCNVELHRNIRAIPGLLVKARYLLRELFRGFDPSDIRPAHGPGSVACRGTVGRGKYDVFHYSPAIDKLYPYSAFSAFGIHTQNPTIMRYHTSWTTKVAPARVVLVPKDSRGPRVISCEPALLQYLQQGLARKIYRLVERHYLTRGFVNFTSQEVNRRIALRSSRDGRWCTIDLADASDRVSCELVKMLFPEHLVPYLMALRSEVAELPDGSIVPLQKYAPMGSALCFPIEALCFWALATAGTSTLSVRRGRCESRSPVYVFGDDILVPSQYFERVVHCLEAGGLQVNKGKCFVSGKFRESCGCDAYNGVDVTPVRIRALIELGRRPSISDVYRLSKNAQAFFDKGYWSTAEFLWNFVENVVGEIPTMGPRFPGICRSSTILPIRFYYPPGLRMRWNVDLQRTEIHTWRLVSRRVKSPFRAGVIRLGHNLIAGMPEAYEDDVAVPHSALAKAGWAPPA